VRCLRYCQTPVAFVHQHWKEGKTGALRMGIENGTYCLGCCWILMVLLFISGVMNLLWIALIAFFVLLEKIVPGTKSISLTAGVALVIYGVTTFFNCC
jgi:predicted metal-binding membrane protein